MSSQLQKIQDQVTANEAVTTSAVTLIKGLADEVAALRDDPAAIDQLVAQMKAQADTLAAAVAANTPAAPAPTPTT